MSMESLNLNERVKTDLSYLAFGGVDWVRPVVMLSLLVADKAA